MPVDILINGENYINYINFSISRSMLALAGSFTIDWSNDFPENFKIKLGDEIVIKIHDQDVITGFVEKINRTHTIDQSIVNISGRDKTLDLIDSHLDGSLTLSPPQSLKSIIEKVLQKINISNISVIDNFRLSEDDDFKKGDIVVSSTGQKAWDFISQYSQKKQVLVTTDGKSNIVLERASDIVLDGSLFFYIQDNERQNNILSINTSIDSSKLYNKYIILSQLNPSSIVQPILITSKSISGQRGEFINNDIRNSRIYVNQATNSQADNICQKRAEWENSHRLAESKTYNYTVQGFNTDEENLFVPNRLIKVYDETSEIDGENLLIKDVKYNYAENTGSTTNLVLIDKDSYKLEPKGKANLVKSKFVSEFL